MSAFPTLSDSDNDGPKEAKGSSRRMSWVQSLFSSTRVDEDGCTDGYSGTGTSEDPFVVDFRQNDRQDAMSFSKRRKWTIAMCQAVSFFAVTFGSSVYASGIPQVMESFRVSDEVATLGLALYVLGFALGPILWAPMSELYGRRLTFIITYTVYVAFTAAAPFSPNITSLLVLRFFASAFGSSAQTNPGAMIADLFSVEERGLVMGIFAACPFLGPALGTSRKCSFPFSFILVAKAHLLILIRPQGPIVGGFVGATSGWRWILGVNAILSGVVWVAALLVTRETYAPVILRSRAEALSAMTGSVYVSRLDVGKPPTTISEKLSISFTRPWILLIRESIVLLTALYLSIIYAILYMFFAAIPIVFGGTRGWGQGIAGLPFVGFIIGIFLAVLACGVDNKFYVRMTAAGSAAGQAVEPESRLRIAMIGSVVLPVGLFLFAWTTYPSVHWIAPVIGTTIFSCGLVMVFISLMNYVVDSCEF